MFSLVVICRIVNASTQLNLQYYVPNRFEEASPASSIRAVTAFWMDHSGSLASKLKDGDKLLYGPVT